jgi:hypothetical protein
MKTRKPKQEIEFTPKERWNIKTFLPNAENIQDLEYIEKVGWHAKGTKPSYCANCKEDLNIPFYFCPENRTAFCWDCARTGNFHCSNWRNKTEHEHFCIKHIKELK